jgi:hypothetical protein
MHDRKWSEVMSVTWAEDALSGSGPVRKYVLRMRNRKLRNIRKSRDRKRPCSALLFFSYFFPSYFFSSTFFKSRAFEIERFKISVSCFSITCRYSTVHVPCGISIQTSCAIWRDQKLMYLTQKRIEMFYSTNQSYHWKLNQSEVAISGRLANQKPGKKNQSERRIQKETTNRPFFPHFSSFFFNLYFVFLFLFFFITHV